MRTKVSVSKLVRAMQRDFTAKNAEGAKNFVAKLCVLCELCGDLKVD